MGFAPRPRIRHGDGDVYQFRIELAGILPAIWRQVQLSGRATLDELHTVIQTVFDHAEELGYHFAIDGVAFHDPDGAPYARSGADAVTLESLGLHSGSRFTHEAEHHGEPWRHIVTVEQIAPRRIGQRLPVCIGAGRAAPPDDCASVEEYGRLLEAAARPRDHFATDHLQWLPENFDPEFADVVSLNASLHRMPRRRPAA